MGHEELEGKGSAKGFSRRGAETQRGNNNTLSEEVGTES